MIKRLTYSVFILLFIPGCEDKPSEYFHHNMPGMESMSVEELNHDTSTVESFLYAVVNPVNEIVLSSQQTIKPAMREIGSSISADGYIAFDERRNKKVSARFGGRVETLYVKYNYQYVNMGEKIMEMYSPEINTIMEEYIHQLSSLDDKNFIRKTKEKLLLLGLAENEISAMGKTGKLPETISVYSPYEGYVLFDIKEIRENAGYSPAQGGMNMGMVSRQNNTGKQGASSLLREGSYVNEGQTLFVVNDFKEVWAIASFAVKDALQIKINAPVTVNSELTDEPVETKINFIEPVYKEGQKFTQARIYLENEKLQYKINSLLAIQVSAGDKKFCIPASAILDLGKRKIVWVKTGKNRFQARNVFTGNEGDGFVEIISGITVKDEIAKDAGFMIDSESLIIH